MTDILVSVASILVGFLGVPAVVVLVVRWWEKREEGHYTMEGNEGHGTDKANL